MISKHDDLRFVDYIWPDVGNPRIRVYFPECYIYVDCNVIFRSAIPNDNNGFISTLDANNVNTSAYIQNKQFRIWSAKTSSSVNSGVTAQANRPYRIQIAVNPNYNGYVLGVDSTWTTRVSLDKKSRIILNRGGSAVIPIAYGTCKIREQLQNYQYNNISYLSPCCYNGEYGMWDEWNNTFYGNDVTGASWTGGSIQS